MCVRFSFHDIMMVQITEILKLLGSNDIIKSTVHQGIPLAWRTGRGLCSQVTCRVRNTKPHETRNICVQQGQDPGICCRMSDPKLPNFGTYVRTIFCQFCPHLDPTYPFRPIYVRIIEQTSVSMKSVRITDLTWNLAQNVCINLGSDCN